jgi:hypothetical protein
MVPAFCILHSALLVSVVGCGSKAKAQTLPDGPPLSVPAAPRHEIVVEQVAEAPPPEPEPVPEPEKPAPAVQTRKPPQPPRSEAPAATSQPPVAAPQPEPPVLRAVPAAAAGDEKKARDLMAKATSDLARVDYQKLSTDGKANYNQSKEFNEQAAQAIKANNVVLALTLAEKAANLAAELVR